MRGADSRSAGFDRVMVRGSGSDDGRANGAGGGGATTAATVVDIANFPELLQSSSIVNIISELFLSELLFETFPLSVKSFQELHFHSRSGFKI